jgi:hypothetical protein
MIREPCRATRNRMTGGSSWVDAAISRETAQRMTNPRRVCFCALKAASLLSFKTHWWFANRVADRYATPTSYMTGNRSFQSCRCS